MEKLKLPIFNNITPATFQDSETYVEQLKVIVEKVNELVEKIKSDPKLLADFQSEPVKAVEKLLGVDLPDDVVQKLIDGMTPGAILEEIDDENERARAARLLEKDSGAGEEGQLRMAGDCLRILHRKRIEQKIAQLREQLPQMTGEDKRSTLLKIQELTKERQTAGRKE